MMPFQDIGINLNYAFISEHHKEAHKEKEWWSSLLSGVSHHPQI